MNDKLYVHIPAQLLADRLSFLLDRHLQPEVACQEVDISKLDLGQLRACAAELTEQGLSTCLHAPFTGFEPGSSKPRLRKKADQICRQSLELAEAIGAKRIVFHPGLPYESSARQRADWLENSLTFWPEYLPQAQQIGTIICVENIYESSPEPLFELLQGIDSPAFGHCFDVGHWNMFHRGRLVDWLNQMSPYLQHLHLHDNHGEKDQHLPIGQGAVNFTALIDWLEKSGLQPTMTLEAHKLPDLDSSLKALNLLLKKGIAVS